MTVLQAVARAGGITPQGSDRRVDINRKVADGREQTFRAKR
jgi:protein involved in polysaccharide export with SLBB domain